MHVAPSDTNFDPKNMLLSYANVMIDNTEKPQYITVRVEVSKTDVFLKEQLSIWEPQGRIYALHGNVRLYVAKRKSFNIPISRSPPSNTITAGHKTQGGTKRSWI